MKLLQIYWHDDEQKHMADDNFKFCPICGKLLIQKVIDNRPRCTCPACGYIHFRNPSVTVSMLIINGDMVLLGKRSGDLGKDLWATPSGFIEFDEDFLSTAIRETKEETNLEIEIVGILNVTDSFFPPEQHFLNIYLLARIIGGQLHAGDDMGEIGWFPLAGPLPEMAFQEDIDLIESYRQAGNQFLPVNRGN